MAAPQSRHPGREELLRQGVQEILRLNPRLIEPAPAFTEEECVAILQDDAALDTIWDAPEGERARLAGYSAAQAVDEDRGK